MKGREEGKDVHREKRRKAKKAGEKSKDDDLAGIESEF